VKRIILILPLLLPPPVQSATPTGSNPFIDMMRSMLDMFEMMQLYQEFSSRSDRNAPFPASRWPAPAAPSGITTTLPSFYPQSTSELEGAWASNTNILFAIKGGLGRIYWARDQYRDFQLEILPPRLRLTDKGSGQSQEFDVSLQGDRLVLRDSQGRLALFRRIQAPPALRDLPTNRDARTGQGGPAIYDYGK